MAASSATEEQEVQLKILVDEEKNRVVFAQAGKDFVDVLLSFLTLPLGTIARVVGTEARIGSISSLYESVANLDEKQFWTETCKEMLLQPRNSMQAYCQELKLNIDDTEPIQYFICDNWDCNKQRSGGLLTSFRNKKCKCGKLMNTVVEDHSSFAKGRFQEGGLVPETATFVISDDLKLMPDTYETSLVLPMKFGCEDFSAIKEQTVHVTQKEIMDLLSCSLLSNTPLTDLFLRKKAKKQFPEVFEPLSVSKCDKGEREANDGTESEQTMKIKVLLRKSDNKILYVLSGEDFVDFLLSFLTFPLGGVEQMLNGNSCMSSLHNLYQSIVDLDGNRYVSSEDLRDRLINSKIAHQFKLENQILPIDEVPGFNYSGYLYTADGFTRGYLIDARDYDRWTYQVYTPLSYLEPQSSSIGKYDGKFGGRGFVKSPSLYMVTDDLAVTPGSSISAVSFLTKLKVSPNDLEERVIGIGKKEGLSILKASLISSSALSNGLCQFIRPIKQEQGSPK